MGDRIAVLKDGVLQQVGTPRDLYESPANAFVAGFIGSPAMNLFEADIVDGGVQFGTATVKVDRKTLEGATGSRVTVGIRPEDFDGDSHRGRAPSLCGFGGRVGCRWVPLRAHRGRRAPHRHGGPCRWSGPSCCRGQISLLPVEHHMHVFDTTTGVRLTQEPISTGS